MSKGKTNSGTGGSSKSSIIVTAPTGSVVYIENQEEKRKDTSGKESRNVWPYTETISRTHLGYTFTTTPSGIRVTGTGAGTGSSSMSTNLFVELSPGTYTVCGDISKTAPVEAQVRIKRPDSTYVYYKDGDSFVIDGLELEIKLNVVVRVSTKTLDTVYYPMIVAGASQIPFEPYYVGARWTFKNCDIGTWTVYASKGGQSATATVEITAEGQLMRYYVNIAYQLQPSDFKFYTTEALTTEAILGTDYQVVDDNDNVIPNNQWVTVKNWKIRNLVSLYCVPLKDGYIDVFLVGGGSSCSGTSGRGGGAGGYTKTQKMLQVEKNVPIAIVIGDGGAANYKPTTANNGGKTTFGTITAAGGKVNTSAEYGTADGGSGGGAPGGASINGANGGSNGNNGGSTTGQTGAGVVLNGGTGQGTTTREFGEPTGKLYAAGGGAAGKKGGSGGDGGGGDGAGLTTGGTAGEPNTGSGSGGVITGGGTTTEANTPHKGGSGIVVFRNAREAA